MTFKPSLAPETGGLGKFQHIAYFIEILWPYHKTRNKAGLLAADHLTRILLLLLRLNPNERLIRRQTSQRQGKSLVGSPSLEVGRLLDVVVKDKAPAHLPSQNQVTHRHILNLAGCVERPEVGVA